MRRHNGFSLLEILVAFAIMAVALTIVLRIFGTGVNTAVNAEDYTVAVQIAESLLARTGVETPLQAGESSGSEADKYDWVVTVIPVTVPVAARPRFKSQQQNEESNPLQLMRVKVSVVWDSEGERRRVVELSGLRLLRNQDS